MASSGAHTLGAGALQGSPQIRTLAKALKEPAGAPSCWGTAFLGARKG